MGYKLDVELKNITSPILLKTGDDEKRFDNGTELANFCFDRKYAVTAVEAKDSVIVMTVKEKSLLPTENWTNKELSFF